MSARLPALLVGATLAASRLAAAADAPPPARFAIIVGVNQSVDRDAALLHYADDDAAGFQELFRTLGARTYLLSRFDENTRRLHPQAVAEAHDPRAGAFAQVVAQAAADVRRARERGVATVLYFVYAGHGNVEAGRGYLALEDGRLYGADLEREMIDPIGAGETHVVVDACYSVFLAWSRGPGGAREEVRGFSALGGLAARPDVGLLLSTSSARESHEWSEFQAGIFSHEVRSGLLGAADADRDGHVTYREIAAFIERANAPVPNEKFRPDVYFKEPSRTGALLDLRPGLAHRVELGGEASGHYYLEDARGVRLADFHNAAGQPLHLVREAGAGRLYLRNADADREYVLDPAPEVLRLAELRPQPSSVASRGAAHEAFSLLFSLPFSQHDVDGFVARRAPAPEPAPRRTRSLRRPVGYGLLGLGAAAGVAGTWAIVSALGLEHEGAGTQARDYDLNRGIDRRNTAAAVLYGASGAALAAGAWLLFAPGHGAGGAPALGVGLAPNGVGVGGTF
ncbi:MAG TPA: caspase family protein [Polyangia bacterium]|nr:caspase family protein [Polyangia bacterium]